MLLNYTNIHFLALLTDITETFSLSIQLKEYEHIIMLIVDYASINKSLWRGEDVISSHNNNNNNNNNTLLQEINACVN